MQQNLLAMSLLPFTSSVLSGAVWCCRDTDGWLDAAMLEVPHNSDATIRLLKARIKSLEEQLGTALMLNQGQCNWFSPMGVCWPRGNSHAAKLPYCSCSAHREGECSD